MAFGETTLNTPATPQWGPVTSVTPAPVASPQSRDSLQRGQINPSVLAAPPPKGRGPTRLLLGCGGFLGLALVLWVVGKIVLAVNDFGAAPSATVSVNSQQGLEVAAQSANEPSATVMSPTFTPIPLTPTPVLPTATTVQLIPTWTPVPTRTPIPQTSSGWRIDILEAGIYYGEQPGLTVPYDGNAEYVVVRIAATNASSRTQSFNKTAANIVLTFDYSDIVSFREIPQSDSVRQYFADYYGYESNTASVHPGQSAEYWLIFAAPDDINPNRMAIAEQNGAFEVNIEDEVDIKFP